MTTGQEGLLTWADLALLGVLLLSAVVGALRGFVFQALSLAGWVVAYVTAPWVAPGVALWLPPATGEGAWQALAAPVLAFVLVLVVCAVLARLSRTLVHATPLQGVDRVLGAGFGLVKGLLLILLLAVLIGFTPFVKHPSWRDSLLRPWLGAALQALSPLFPQDLHRLVLPPAPAAGAKT
ncbi:MAG: CvpA family protein [Inhella sp.]|jgi:membrane protein required for colicin V production|uniref:CvpA family protein n=1 Tax=Inhella sp. TaxID=1921806 RepID=UPI0022C3623B|nr:CvpA family protein [Inhella sp.]MCZ8234349.1 CvpA family protein [Inhella sp.]